MRRDRYQLLQTIIHYNVNTCQIGRGHQEHDSSHKFRPVFDLLNKIFNDAYSPARNLKIDESTVGFKGNQSRSNVRIYVRLNTHVNDT